MRETNLVLHCGAHAVERDVVGSISTPEPTETWHPIPHMTLIQHVEGILGINKLKVVKEAHSLTHDGMRYFGLMQIQNGQTNEDYAWVLGLRNSHDKSFPAGLVAGASVFVCDNLSFSGEVSYARKHTTKIEQDLPFLTERAIGRLMNKWHRQDHRIASYKQREITDAEAHDIIIRSVDVRACPPSYIPSVLGEWRTPQHEEFKERTIWSLFNGFTYILGSQHNLVTLSKRTEALHGLLDSYSGLGPEPETLEMHEVVE